MPCSPKPSICRLCPETRAEGSENSGSKVWSDGNGCCSESSRGRMSSSGSRPSPKSTSKMNAGSMSKGGQLSIVTCLRCGLKNEEADWLRWLHEVLKKL